jgi:hypothetical protein
MTTSRLKLLLSLTLAVTSATVATSDTRPNTRLDSYAVFATQDLRTRGLTVDCGNVGVEGDVQLRRTLVVSDGELSAGRVFTLGTGVSCSTRQLFLHADAPAGQPCGVPTLFTGPILGAEDAAAQCEFPTRFECSNDPATDVLVGPGEIRVLPPGKYRDIRVRGAAGRAGTLVLQGGEYDFCSLRAYRRAQIFFDAPATVRVAGDFFRIGDLTQTGPSPNSGVSAGDVRLYSNGQRVSFRRRAQVHALVCAPNARLLLDNRVEFEGRVIARDIRTDRFVRVFTPGCVVTTTTVPGSTTTTRTSTTTTTTSVPPTCGNGVLDASEECDDDRCRGSCASPDGAFVTSCSGALLRCISCTIDRSECPPTTTTSTTRPRTTTTRLTTSTTTTTSTTLPPEELPRELCGDCVDNDANGLTDFEDPTCCTSPFTMSLKRARLTPKGTASKLGLNVTLARAGLTRVDPTSQGLSLQFRPAQASDILCARIRANGFTRKKNTFKFKDPSGTMPGAQGLTKVVVKIANDGSVRLRARGKQVKVGPAQPGMVQITAGFVGPNGVASANRCSRALQTFRPARKGLRAP